MRNVIIRALTQIALWACDAAERLTPHAFDDPELLQQLSVCADFSDLPEGHHVIAREELEARIIKGMEAATWH